MLKDKCHIERLLNILYKNDLITTISDSSNLFYDEPFAYSFGVELNSNTKVLDSEEYFVTKIKDPPCGSSSFRSRQEALRKAVMEAVERLCLYIYPIKKTKFFTPNDLLAENKNIIDIGFYNKTDKSIQDNTFGWIEGKSLVTDENYFIPSQLVYLQYLNYLQSINKREIELVKILSNGAAAGCNNIKTLLRGVYEVVERDAAMTFFLLKLTPPLININSLEIPLISRLNKLYTDYRIKWYLFKITNDLSIPTFLSILVENGLGGPAVSVGVKSSMCSTEAIIGSTEEALRVRIWQRHEMIQHKTDFSFLNSRAVKTVSLRARYWSSPKRLRQISYLIDQKPQAYELKKWNKNSKQTLSYLINTLSKKGYNPLYVDITSQIFKKAGVYAYKVIIPGLQELYLDERLRFLRPQRLKQVSRFFGQKRLLISKTPHFFL